MGTFHVCYEGRNGNREFDSHNLMPNEARRMLLSLLVNDNAFYAGTIMGLIDDANFSAISAADTYDNINQVGNGWEEFTDYQPNPALGHPAGSRLDFDAHSVTGDVATWGADDRFFEFDATGTVRGMFILKGNPVSEALEQGNHAFYQDSISLITPCLWGITLFDSPLDVIAGARLCPSYTMELSR